MKEKDDFLDSRHGMFTASEIHRLLIKGKAVGEVFGGGAIAYINEKVAEFITGESKAIVKSAATDWGLEHEADAVKWFTLITGKEVTHYGVNEYKFFPYKNMGGCSPDGKLINETAITQFKCPFLTANHVQYLLAPIDKGERQIWLKTNQKQYYAQCQFEMMSVNVERCYFASYDPRTIDEKHRMAIIELLPDIIFQKDIEMRVEMAHGIVADAVKKLN